MSSILIVEDDALRILQFRRELAPYELEIANSADAAMKILAQRRFDLIFLDHDLESGGRVYIDPYESNTGYQVAMFLAAHPEHASTPVVVHSYNWFGANKIVKQLETAVYVPFGIYPLAELARLFLEENLDPRLRNLGRFLGGAEDSPESPT